jgi:hypothetical protein
VAGTNPTTNSGDGVDKKWLERIQLATNLGDGVDKKWLERIQPPIGSMALMSGRNQSSHLIKIPRRIGAGLQQAKKWFKETVGTPTTCLCS